MLTFRTAVPGLLLAAILPLAAFHRPSQEPAAVPAQDEAKTAKARELLAMTGASGMGKNMLDMMMTQFAKMPGLPDGFANKFKEMADVDQLVDMIVPIYCKHLDVDVMESTIEFFKSEKGRKWIAAQSKITQESAEVGQKWGQELAMKVMQKLQEGK